MNPIVVTCIVCESPSAAIVHRPVDACALALCRDCAIEFIAEFDDAEVLQ